MTDVKSNKIDYCDKCNTFDASIMAAAILSAFALGIILAYEARGNCI